MEVASPAVASSAAAAAAAAAAEKAAATAAIAAPAENIMDLDAPTQPSSSTAELIPLQVAVSLPTVIDEKRRVWYFYDGNACLFPACFFYFIYNPVCLCSRHGQLFVWPRSSRSAPPTAHPALAPGQLRAAAQAAGHCTFLVVVVVVLLWLFSPLTPYASDPHRRQRTS